ncbi:MAG TPA: glycosyltransferase family 39 protein [Polyangia bacterium]|jgi:dolichyl-phosphate-mannose--protein O-mannosyl transferase|nr:glycosyltransferase family 39 protein [Polyangia bacterium]
MTTRTTTTTAPARHRLTALFAAIGSRRAAFAALAPAARATTVLLGLMIVGGVVLRLWGIGAAPRFTFDEHHFIPNARHYLLGLPDENDHPPLGKLLIAAGILFFGDNPTGWRAASVILGLQTLVVSGALARELFSSRRAGWFAAAFFAADGFFLAYSRTALLDGGLACLVLWSLLAALVARGWRGVLLSAVLAGLATSVKWSGALVVLPGLAAVLLRGRVPWWQVLPSFALATPATHVALWLASFALTHRPVDPRALASLMADLLRRHIKLGHDQNALASPWYSWPLLYHPIVVKLTDVGIQRRYASSVGNPLLFLSGTLAVLLTLLGGGLVAVGARASTRAQRVVPPAERRAALLLAGGWVAMLGPWIVARGSYTFMYHYLPSYGLALVLVAGMAALVERRHPRLVATYVALALALAIYFAPVWAEFPVTTAQANRRLLFIPWQP